MSAAAQRCIARYEDRPGDVARAVARWSRAVHGPDPGLPVIGYPCPCCTDHDARHFLEDALHALPARGARELAAVVHGLDAVYLDHAPFDPVALNGARWWVGLLWGTR